MGFWGSVGKFAGKAALGIVAPGTLAGYEYQKAKEEREMLKELDEVIETLFQNLAKIQDGGAWNELLVLVRGGVVQCLSNKDTRERLSKEHHPDEQGRTCCRIAAAFCEKLLTSHAAVDRSELDLLRGVLNITEAICIVLDNRIASASLTKKEEGVVRFLFDMACTRMPHMSMAIYGQRKNVAATLSEVLKDMLFSDEDDGMSRMVKTTCREVDVSYAEIRRKMGC